MLHFVEVKGTKIIKILENEKNEVCLGLKSFEELAALKAIINYRLELLALQDFQSFYTMVLKDVHFMGGDELSNIRMKCAHRTPSVNICTMLEAIHLFPNKLRVDVEVINLF